MATHKPKVSSFQSLITKDVPMVSNQTWLVKISVKLSIFIHRNSSCKWTLISMKGWWVFFFLRKVVSYLEQFVVLKDIEQHKKLAFPRRQGNQACWPRRSGHNFSIPPPSCSFLHLFSFLLEVAFVQPINYTDQMQRSLDSFCQKRLPTQKLWRGNGRLRKTTKNKYRI